MTGFEQIKAVVTEYQKRRIDIFKTIQEKWSVQEGDTVRTHLPKKVEKSGLRWVLV